MVASKFKFALLFCCLAACDARGCGSGQTLTLIYRGATSIQPETQLMKDEVSIGFVDSVQKEKEGQRILLRVREASLIQEQDAFVPYTDDDDHKGLRVIHNGGAPRQPGTTFYYPPMDAPGSVTENVTAVAPKGEFDNPYIAESESGPTDSRLDSPEPVVAFKDDTYNRRSVRTTLGQVMEAPGIPPEIKARLGTLQKAALRPGDEVLILEQTKRELPEIRKAMIIEGRNAFQRGDRMAAKETFDAVQKTILLENRLPIMIRRARENPRPADEAPPKVEHQSQAPEELPAQVERQEQSPVEAPPPIEP